MRVCVVGGGLSGALLAWRLGGHGVRVDLVAGGGAADPSGWRPADATAASGGGVRAYETHPLNRSMAGRSLAELLASPTLRVWAGYRRLGSTYLRPAWPEADREIDAMNDAVPGSARLCDAAELRQLGWYDLDAGTVGVVEAEAGHIDPQAFRSALLADLARGDAVRVERVAAAPIHPPGDAGRPRCRVGGAVRDYDAVVIAAGAWTGELLTGADGSGFYRTRAIQYALHAASGPRPTFFVDDTTGLYGRPYGGDMMLIGVPAPVYGVPPDGGDTSPDLDRTAVELIARRRPDLRIGPVSALVRAADCYTDPPTLALRPVDGRRGVFTFAGGSGGAAKTALAASGIAADGVIASLG